MTAPIRRRSRAREIAMQVLFQFDVRGADYASDLGSTVADICRAELRGADREEQHDMGGPDRYAEAAGLAGADDEKLTAADIEVLGFATRLVEGTLLHRATIDEKLQAVTRNWDLRRMAIVDRNVLRMAVFELMFCDDVPPKVAINEAIEISKKFSTANSGGFVNGILDRIRIDLEQARGQQATGIAAQPGPAQPGPAQPSPAQPSPAQPHPAQPHPAQQRAAQQRATQGPPPPLEASEEA